MGNFTFYNFIYKWIHKAGIPSAYMELKNMIDIKSNLDRLEDSASTFYKRGGNDGASTALSSGDALQTASDIRGAIQDILNLRDSNAILERNIKEMSASIIDLNAELNTLKTGPVDLGDAINAAIKSYVESALVNNGQLDALEARIETVEQFKDDLDTDSISGLEGFVDDRIESSEMDGNREDATRDTVRDMIRDGDIIVTVDVS